MMKKENNLLPIYIFTSLAIGILLGRLLNFPTPSASVAENTHRSKLNRLIDFIESEYVDQINTDSIVDLTVNNILSKLDPHSVYLPPADQQEAAEYMKGDFVGIGVNFYMFRDTVAIIRPTENGPAEKAGLKPGDRILFAGSHKLFGKQFPTDSLFAKLKGQQGSQVELTVFRKSENKTFKVTLTRQVVPIKSVEAAVMLTPNMGYLKINRFAESTYQEFKEAITKLVASGATGMVIDVRDNGGGYLEKAISIADEILADKELIVFTKNKKSKVEKSYASAGGIFEKGKVYILINENSASASEILAGAVQDNDRGLVLGRRSFGKGLVQREMDFEDGSAVRLTVARYYTPSGRSIQKHYKKGIDDYNSEFEKRFESGELYTKDSIKVADSLKFRTKKGRVVYAGGGIVPDVFVPLEVEQGSEGIAYLMNSGIVGHFVFEQLDQNRKAFSGLTFQQLLSKMEKTDQYFNAFKNTVFQSGMELNGGVNKALVKRYILAEFARQLYGESKYYEVILREDAMVKKAMEIHP
jgi:carboxyl-terminal processing protease